MLFQYNKVFSNFISSLIIFIDLINEIRYAIKN